MRFRYSCATPTLISSPVIFLTCCPTSRMTWQAWSIRCSRSPLSQICVFCTMNTMAIPSPSNPVMTDFPLFMTKIFCFTVPAIYGQQSMMENNQIKEYALLLMIFLCLLTEKRMEIHISGLRMVLKDYLEQESRPT